MNKTHIEFNNNTSFLIYSALLFVIAFAVGHGIAYNSYEQKEQSCVNLAEQDSDYGQLAYQAFLFAKCMNPEKFDPQYDFKRFNGK